MSETNTDTSPQSLSGNLIGAAGRLAELMQGEVKLLEAMRADEIAAQLPEKRAAVTDYRNLFSRLHGGYPTAGKHDRQLPLEAKILQAMLHLVQIPLRERLHIGVYHCGAGAFVLTNLTRHFRRQTEEEIGIGLRQHPSSFLLMMVIDMGVEKTDSQRLYSGLH